MSFTLHTAEFLILFSALSLLFNDIGRIMQCAIRKNILAWSICFLIGVGLLNIIVSCLMIVHPLGYGVPLLATIISIATLITGIQMIDVDFLGIKSLQQYNIQSQVHDLR